jgi:hypothetical protein
VEVKDYGELLINNITNSVFDVVGKGSPNSCFGGDFRMIRKGLVIYGGRRPRRRRRRRLRLLINGMLRTRSAFVRNGKFKPTFVDSAMMVVNLAARRPNGGLLRRMANVLGMQRREESTGGDMALRS